MKQYLCFLAVEPESLVVRNIRIGDFHLFLLLAINLKLEPILHCVPDLRDDRDRTVADANSSYQINRSQVIASSKVIHTHGKDKNSYFSLRFSSGNSDELSHSFLRGQWKSQLPFNFPEKIVYFL